MRHPEDQGRQFSVVVTMTMPYVLQNHKSYPWVHEILAKMNFDIDGMIAIRWAGKENSLIRWKKIESKGRKIIRNWWYGHVKEVMILATRKIAEETRPVVRYKRNLLLKCNNEAVTCCKHVLRARKPERQRGKPDLMSIYNWRKHEERTENRKRGIFAP